MKTYYKSEICKIVTKDDYENGCDIYGQDYGMIKSYQASTIKELINKVELFCGGKASIFYSDLENNRLSIQVLENSNGFNATKLEVERWKNKEIDLYLADYSIYITKIIEDDNLKEVFSLLNLETV